MPRPEGEARESNDKKKTEIVFHRRDHRKHDGASDTDRAPNEVALVMLFAWRNFPSFTQENTRGYISHFGPDGSWGGVTFFHCSSLSSPPHLCVKYVIAFIVYSASVVYSTETGEIARKICSPSVWPSR